MPRAAGWTLAAGLSGTLGCLLPPEGEPPSFSIPPTFRISDRFPSPPVLRISAGEQTLGIPQNPPPGACLEFDVGVFDVQDPDSDRVRIRWVKNNRNQDPNAPPALLAEDEQSSPSDPFDVLFRVVPPNDFNVEVRVASFLGSQQATLHLFMTDAPDWAPVEEDTVDFTQVVLPAGTSPEDFTVVEVQWSLDFYQDNLPFCPGEVQ